MIRERVQNSKESSLDSTDTQRHLQNYIYFYLYMWTTYIYFYFFLDHLYLDM